MFVFWQSTSTKEVFKYCPHADVYDTYGHKSYIHISPLACRASYLRIALFWRYLHCRNVSPFQYIMEVDGACGAQSAGKTLFYKTQHNVSQKIQDLGHEVNPQTLL